MHPTIIFIHGMFLTGKSWDKWVRFFEQRGYRCLAPSWPLHDGEPAQLRASIPEGTGELSLEMVINHYARIAIAERVKPIFIGHSVGGLVVQRLIAGGLGQAGVCISSVAPNKMLSLDWDFLRNSAMIANPFKGDVPVEMTPEGFHKNFANTMSREASDAAWNEFAVHESRNVLRDCLGKDGQIDLTLPHAPLLFLAGDSDRIVPDELNQKNARAYTDERSITDFTEFPGRGHYLCGQSGWEDLAHRAAIWLTAHAQPAMAA